MAEWERSLLHVRNILRLGQNVCGQHVLILASSVNFAYSGDDEGIVDTWIKVPNRGVEGRGKRILKQTGQVRVLQPGFHVVNDFLNHET